MKKLLTAIFALMLVVALLSPAAFADSDKDKNKDNGNKEKSTQQQDKKEEQEAKHEEVKARIEEHKEEQAELKEEFRERMMERAELKTATKEQLQEQRQLVAEYKNQLKEFKLMLEGLTEEERLAYGDELEALMLQVKEAQRSQLEIRRASHAEIKAILPGVRVGNPPTEEEVVEVIEEVLGDIV